MWKTFKTAPNLPKSQCPSKFNSWVESALFRENAKNTRATSQSLQASVC